MNNVESYCLFIMAGLFAYVFTILYFYLNRCYENWSRKKQIERLYKNDLFKQRCKNIHNHIKDYYYTLAVNNPKLLAAELADSIVSKMSRKNLINTAYSKIKNY